MGGVSTFVGKNNGRGFAWHFSVGVVFGQLAWISVPYLHMRPTSISNPSFDVIANQRISDIREGREPVP